MYIMISKINLLRTDNVPLAQVRVKKSAAMKLLKKRVTQILPVRRNHVHWLLTVVAHAPMEKSNAVQLVCDCYVRPHYKHI